MYENYNDLINISKAWIEEASRVQYFHKLTWLGRPIIQVPQDTYAVQELIWNIRPDLIIETGIAHGGSIILSASMLALLDYCDAVNEKKPIDPFVSLRKVIGVDIDIRAHNREAIEKHSMAHKIEMIQGSSTDPEVFNQIKEKSSNYNQILIFLDSNHTHEHVLAELEIYAPMTSLGSYCVVWDTGVEDLPEGFCKDRPWGKGNNPKTAVLEYLRILKENTRYARDGAVLNFEVDKMIEYKLAITASPSGFLRRIL